MRAAPNYGFVILGQDVKADILIPRYYDPRIERELSALRDSHQLITINQLVAAQQLVHSQGDYVPKIFYGSGPYPYVRTSDLANWEVKASPKHGVAREVFERYSADQDVQPEDIFFVHEGTYLIGSAAIVTTFDGPMLFQHHLARLRVLPQAPIGPYFLLAALESRVVQRQIRSKQFSADIIDSVVGRLGEVRIPIPKSSGILEHIESEVRGAVLGRAEARERLSYVVREIDGWLRGEMAGPVGDVFEWRPVPREYAGRPAFLNQRRSFVSFGLRGAQVRNDILLPKYYDPRMLAIAKAYEGNCDLMSIAALIEEGLLSAGTGDEVGKMVYGTGPIPFLRTSDLGSWELKRNPKQGVSSTVHEVFAGSQDLQAQDILLVRDGTYLVGSSVLVFEDDLPALYCGGLVKLRSLNHSLLPPPLLFLLLNLPFVRQQMRNKQFTRDVIDTLGNRLGEVVLPIPKDTKVRRVITEGCLALLVHRNALRGQLNRLVQSMFVAKETP